MTIIPNRKAFLSLTEENQDKVEYIYLIAVTAHNSNIRPMDVEEFDYLYDMSIQNLIEYTIQFKHSIEHRDIWEFFVKSRSA